MKGHEIMGDMMEYMEGRFFGKYRGVVESNKDCTDCGRLEVCVPQVMGQQPIWAMPCVPYAGKNMGLYAIPEKGAAVWVEFEAGDPSHPIWVGCFWADDQLPKDQTKTRVKPAQKIIRSNKGLMVSLDDDKEVITVSDKDGKNLITIEVKKGKLRLEAAQKVVVEASQIELVENATHPVVFGDKLLQYLNQLVSLHNSHLHPGQTIFGFVPVTPAPPVPSFPPATPNLISKRVKSG